MHIATVVKLKPRVGADGAHEASGKRGLREGGGGGGEERATTLTRSPKAGKLLIEASLLDLSAVRCIKLLMTIELDLDFYAPQRQYYAIWL